MTTTTLEVEAVDTVGTGTTVDDLMVVIGIGTMTGTGRGERHSTLITFQLG
jgi:hypothetical protein